MSRKHHRNGSTENGGKRNWSELPADEWDRIATIYAEGSQAQLVHEAAALGTNIDALGRQIRSYNLVKRKLEAKYLAAAVPESKTPVYNDFIVIEADDAIVVSDIEIPDHDPFVLRLALLAGMRHGIRRIILAGDVVNARSICGSELSGTKLYSSE